LYLQGSNHLFELAGLRTAKIAEELGCHPKTVRKRLHRFNAEGLEGLGDRPGAGRKPRITEDERSKIIALVSKDQPAKLPTRLPTCNACATLRCYGGTYYVLSE
jgi:transposase